MNKTTIQTEVQQITRQLCAECQVAIPLERLAILPQTRLCATCKARAEQRSRKRV